MSERNGAAPVRVVLVGATGLIGRSLIAQTSRHDDLRVIGLARRECPLPQGARVEMFVAEPIRWPDVIEAVRPDVLVNALGTTWRKAGKSEAAFRAVDHALVLTLARAAQSHGVRRMITVSSVGATLATRNLYLKVKGDAERDLGKLRFLRLDILRPGLLRGAREGDRRPLERIGNALAPAMNAALHGGLRKYRAIPAETVAGAIIALIRRTMRGRYVHDNDALLRLAQSVAEPAQ